jgi:putative ABC transport system ATP-binding protein
MSPEPIVELIVVVKSYGQGDAEVYALRSITMSVAPGELVAVMGPSGCGKSTLLHLAGALELPSAGRVRVAGRDLAGLSAEEQAELRRRDVGYVFQRLNLIPSLTAVENVMLPLELDGVAARQARQRAVTALADVGLEQQVDRYPDDFSGGQQQRIAIARALVGERKLLLADEPTGALDTRNADEVMAMLTELPAQRGTAVVLVTHEPRFASYADRVVLLRDGLIVDQTPQLPAYAMSAAGAERAG